MISLIASNPMQLAEGPVFTAQGTLRWIKSTLIVVPFSRGSLCPCGQCSMKAHIHSVGYLAHSVGSVISPFSSEMLVIDSLIALGI